MKAKTIPNGLMIQAPAKLNLFFEVLYKRPDCFHEIVTITTLVDYYDELLIQKDLSNVNRSQNNKNDMIHCDEQQSPDNIHFRCLDSNGSELDLKIPSGQKNLVLKAINLFQERTGIIEPISVELIKRIPTQAGLGGGSSDAAAMLWGLNELWQTHLSPGELQKMGAELGSDVPLFLIDSGTVLGKGRGEIVEPLENIEETSFVLLKPPFGLSTASVYAQCEKIQKMKEYLAKNVNSLLNENQTALLNDWPSRIFNRLEDSAFLFCENLKKYKKKMKLLDVLGVQMTGSGSCFFAICPNQETALRVASLLESKKMGQIIIAKSCSR